MGRKIFASPIAKFLLATALPPTHFCLPWPCVIWKSVEQTKFVSIFNQNKHQTLKGSKNYTLHISNHGKCVALGDNFEIWPANKKFWPSLTGPQRGRGERGGCQGRQFFGSAKIVIFSTKKHKNQLKQSKNLKNTTFLHLSLM